MPASPKYEYTIVEVNKIFQIKDNPSTITYMASDEASKKTLLQMPPDAKIKMDYIKLTDIVV